MNRSPWAVDENFAADIEEAEVRLQAEYEARQLRDAITWANIKESLVTKREPWNPDSPDFDITLADI